MSDTIVKVLPYSVDLEEPLQKTYLETHLVTQDNNAHQFNITLLRNKTTIDLPSGTIISAYFIRYCDNATISLTGTANGSMVSVTLKKACYNKGGQFALVIKAAIDGVVNTVFYGEGSMLVSITDTILDEENVVPSLEDLLAQIAVIEEAVNAANTATENTNTAIANANNATENANNAAAQIDGLTVSAVKGDDAGAAVSVVDGVKHIFFTLPKGDKGDIGPTGSVDNLSINGKPVASGDITLTPEDVGALPSGGTAADASKLGGKTWEELMLAIYPVGSIYMAANSVSPQTLFGGEWEQLKDRFLLGAGDTYANGNMGGAAAVSLTASQIAEHTHKLSLVNPDGTDGSKSTSYIQYGYSGEGNTFYSNANAMDSAGGGEPHDNMPPYLVVYMWKRVS